MNRLLNKLSAFAAVILASAAAAFTQGIKFFENVLFGPDIVRARTCDVAFTYRMGAGFPGDVNRTHPASVLPGLINTTNPPKLYGNPVIINTADNTHRGVIAADGSVTAAKIYGVIVRPYPTQQMTGGMSSAIGAAPAPVSGVADFLRMGFIMCKLPAGSVVTKGGTVHVWAAADSGSNIQGALAPAASGTNTLTVTNAQFTGPADANGNVGVEVWPA